MPSAATTGCNLDENVPIAGGSFEKLSIDFVHSRVCRFEQNCNGDLPILLVYAWKNLIQPRVRSAH